MLVMAIKRSGPPTTHDRITWRVPLDGVPSDAWQRTFEAGTASPSVGAPKGVKFEPTALTFRSDEGRVAAWVEAIDGWIAHANRAATDVAAARDRDATRAQERTEARRQEARDANEKFKNL
jgi:hypothetical protein